jgi:serine/threonine-protein kinase
MGEVYRAEDLTLNQTVAIKFLPAVLSQDEAALARFHSEVRIARQISHPSVCRVFDIGDADGTPFLSMEYVDGEDLASVVRRFGRIAPDKAIEMARQICAGLAAAHERGVVHRDLKPANLMLDGAGKIRIMDFGLAGIAANIKGVEVRAGTPAYMAPEQLAGKEVTIKSDLYSLGLVLLEVLTGKRVFEAATLPELIKLRENSSPSNPSSQVRDLDPLLERIILRCLEREPAQRPASALQVAAALPGGDPLAAALAAGETPSPEMVAASGASEGIRPQFALLCLLGVILGSALFAAVAQRSKIISLLPLHDSPEVLSAHARQMIQAFGYTDAPRDSAWGFLADDGYLKQIRTKDHSPTRWQVLRKDEPAAENFWYRQSPRELRAFGPSGNLLWGRIQVSDPPQEVSGMTFVQMSPAGKLLLFEAVPPQKDEATTPAPAPDWGPLFAAAALNPANFQPTHPEWFPLAWGDARAAWTGTFPGREDIPLRVEAAAYRGKPIYFELIAPWDHPDRMQSTVSSQSRFAQLFSITFLLVLILGGAWIAYRNLRLDRGDFRGALRLASFILLVNVATGELLTHHNQSPFEVYLLVMALASGLFFAAITWMLYIALEPYVRRRWPDTLVSWTRMLAGNLRDPVVGRDLLIGVLAGVALAIFEHSQILAEIALHRAPSQPTGFSAFALEGFRGSLATLISQVASSVSTGLAIFFIFFLARLVCRKNWIAAVVTVALFSIASLGAENVLIDLIFSVPVFAAFMWLLLRFGLLTLAVTVMADQLLNVVPGATPFGAWYTEGGLTALIAIVLLAGYGFHTSRAGRPLFTTNILDT